MSISRSHALAYAAMALYVCMSSLLSPMYKPCLAAGMQPITTMLVRFMIVGAGLLLWSFSSVQRRAQSRGFLSQRGVRYRMYLLGVLRSIELLLWAYALKGTNTFVVNILGNSSPLFVLAASVLIFHEKVPFKVACGLGVTLCGLLVVSLSGGSGGANPLSVALMLVAALDYTVALFLSRDLRTGDQPVPTSLLMGVQFAVCSVVFFLFCMFTHAPLFPQTARTWLLVLGITFCNTFLGLVIPIWALGTLKPATVSIISLANPLASAVTCYLFLGEIPSLQVVIGGFIVLAGLFLYIWQDEKARQAALAAATPEDG